MKRKVLLLFVMFMCSVGTWAYSVSKDYGDGKTVDFSDGTTGVQQLTVGAGGLAEWFNDATLDKSYLNSTDRTKLVITGTLNADDIAAIKTYFTPFTTVDMEGATLEEGASVKGMQLPNAQYMALPHGTPIADMKALKSGCPNLKAVAATNADPNPTEFTGYSWAAGEIYNICQTGLIKGIAAGNCANEMSKLTIGGNVDDRDVSTYVAADNVDNEKSVFKNGVGATFSRNGVETACAKDYLAPTHGASGYSPWKGDLSIELDFTEALFANKGDLALVSKGVTELLLPVDPSFTEIKANMFANLYSLKHAVIPNNIVTIGDAAFYVDGSSSQLEEISIGNGIKTIGNAAFAAPSGNGRSKLTDVRFATGISDVKILASVFSGCTAIKHMTLPEGIVTLGEACFKMLNDLESVHLPSTLQYIGRQCFQQTGLTSLTIPTGVKIIDWDAFGLCRITDIYLMAENMSQLPYIYAKEWNKNNPEMLTEGGTFTGAALNGNNTTPQVDEVTTLAKMDPEAAEEQYRLSVANGNTIARLHYSENLKSFIDFNPWYVPGQVTPKPSTNSLIPYGGNGGINEAEGLSDTYFFKDKEGNTYPCANANDLTRPTMSAYFNTNSNEYDYNGNNTDYPVEDASQYQQPYYNPETGELIPFTEATDYMYKVLRKEGWRQFTFKEGDAGSEDIVFNKSYENIWYTMCFPFSLTDEQLETAFNAEYNIADFSGVEIVTEDGDGKPLDNKSLVIHFNKIAKPKYYDQNHNEYQRVEGSKQTKQMGRSYFSIYTYTRNGDEYKYVETYSNKSYAKDGNKENGIVYIDGYLAQAGHPYMIHPNLGTKQGDVPVVAHMVGINYYSKDADEINQLCKDRARSIDLGTGKGYEGVTYSNVDLSDIAVKDNELTENIDQKTYSGYGGQTYTFIGNCNQYDATVPAMPSYENGGLQPEPSYPEGVKPTETIENPNPELKDPAENYEAGLLALYDAPVTYYNKNGSWERKTSTYGEIIEYKNLFVAYSDNGKNYYTQANGGDDPLDFSAMQNYFGRTDYFTDEEYNLLKNMCTDVAAWNVGSSTPEYQAYLNNKAAWDAYNAAKEAYLAENPGATEEDYEAYVSGKVSEYNSEVQRVRETNAAAITAWRASLADHEVLIPTNAYFLSRKSTEYYTHFFREIAPMSGREAGHGRWTRYSAVLVPNATALAGIEAGVEPGQASGAKAVEMLFDEAYSNFYDATAIEEIVEEAKEKGQKVEYMDVVVSIDGKVVRRGNTSLEGLPSGLYIVNGKKYFVK